MELCLRPSRNPIIKTKEYTMYVYVFKILLKSNSKNNWYMYGKGACYHAWSCQGIIPWLSNLIFSLNNQTSFFNLLSCQDRNTLWPLSRKWMLHWTWLFSHTIVDKSILHTQVGNACHAIHFLTKLYFMVTSNFVHGD